MKKLVAKAVISDLDCTLVYTLKRFFDVFNEGLMKVGRRPIPLEEFFKHYVADTLDFVVAPRSLPRRSEVLHDFWMEFLRRYRGDDPGAMVIPGAREALEFFHGRGVPVGVMTSCIVPVEKLERELRELGIKKYVAAIATAHEVDLEKQHHFCKLDIIKLAAEKLGACLKDCVVVGDYWNDIRDGRRAGAKTVAVLTGLMRKDLLMKYRPNAIIESFSDLPKVLKL